MAEKLRLYRQYQLLKAESAGLEFNKDIDRIREIAKEEAEIAAKLDLRAMENAKAQVGGLYMWGEDLSDVFVIGAADRWAYSYAALDFLVDHLATNVGFPVLTVTGFCHTFGQHITAMLFDAVEESSAGLRQQWRRLEAEIEDKESGESRIITARIGDDTDDAFDEASYAICDENDENSTLITIGSVSVDDIADLIEERDRAARRALRGEPHHG